MTRTLHVHVADTRQRRWHCCNVGIFSLKLTLSYSLLTLEPVITIFSSSGISSHTLLSINIRFLLEQYLSGTLFLKPASTRIPSPHSRHSSVTRPERCAHPHRRDTRKWSDDYRTRTRNIAGVVGYTDVPRQSFPGQTFRGQDVSWTDITLSLTTNPNPHCKPRKHFSGKGLVCEAC